MAYTHTFDDSILPASEEENVTVAEDPQKECAPVAEPQNPRSRQPPRKGRARRVAPAIDLGLSPDDLERIQKQRTEMIQNYKTRIQNLNLEESHRLMTRWFERDPSVLFDLLDSSGPLDPSTVPPVPPTVPPLQDVPGWCVCGNCKEMPTVLENKCCGQRPPATCISRLPEMDVYIVQPGHLRLARRIWNDVRAQVDPVELGASNRQFRYAAYRQFVVWQYGALGHGHRVVIPSCCVMRIRNCYPDPHGQYKGFVPGRV